MGARAGALPAAGPPVRGGAGRLLRHGRPEAEGGRVVREHHDPPQAGAGVLQGGLLRPELPRLSAKQGISSVEV